MATARKHLMVKELETKTVRKAQVVIAADDFLGFPMSEEEMHGAYSTYEGFSGGKGGEDAVFEFSDYFDAEMFQQEYGGEVRHLRVTGKSIGEFNVEVRDVTDEQMGMMLDDAESMASFVGYGDIGNVTVFSFEDPNEANSFAQMWSGEVVQMSLKPMTKADINSAIRTEIDSLKDWLQSDDDPQYGGPGDMVPEIEGLIRDLEALAGSGTANPDDVLALVNEAYSMGIDLTDLAMAVKSLKTQTKSPMDAMSMLRGAGPVADEIAMWLDNADIDSAEQAFLDAMSGVVETTPEELAAIEQAYESFNWKSGKPHRKAFVIVHDNPDDFNAILEHYDAWAGEMDPGEWEVSDVHNEAELIAELEAAGFLVEARSSKRGVQKQVTFFVDADVRHELFGEFEAEFPEAITEDNGDQTATVLMEEATKNDAIVQFWQDRGVTAYEKRLRPRRKQSNYEVSLFVPEPDVGHHIQLAEAYPSYEENDYDPQAGILLVFFGNDADAKDYADDTGGSVSN